MWSLDLIKSYRTYAVSDSYSQNQSIQSPTAAKQFVIFVCRLLSVYCIHIENSVLVAVFINIFDCTDTLYYYYVKNTKTQRWGTMRCLQKQQCPFSHWFLCYSLHLWYVLHWEPHLLVCEMQLQLWIGGLFASGQMEINITVRTTSDIMLFIVVCVVVD